MNKYLALIFMTGLAIIQQQSYAQKESPHDIAYYDTYPGSLTARVYFTQKYASLNFPSQGSTKDLRYNANAKLGFGVGATYKNITVNVAYGASFLNTRKEARGKTKGIDFQLHVTPYKWVVDATATAYKGSYISPKGYGAVNNMSFYYRPDVKFDLFGLDLYRIPNAYKFSYRAALVQNEWQKKSAGSLLYGGALYYGSLKGDSSLVPTGIVSQFPQAGIDNIHFITIGPGIGYAYTLVAAQHLFLMGSLVGNLDINFSTEDKGEISNNKVSVDPLAIYKAAVGYNGSTWSVAAILTGNALLFKGDASDKAYFLSSGNYKLFIAKKIMLHKK